MTFAKLAFLALPLSLVACAATTDATDGTDADTEEASSEEALTGKVADVSADYVGSYKTIADLGAGSVASLRLRKDKSYEMVVGDKTEQGKFKVRKGNEREVEIRLTQASGTYKIYRGVLGDGFRPQLRLSRLRTVSILERAPTSCASVNCTAGYGCDVEEKDGVPGPVCNARVPAWKIALAGYDLWGADVKGVLHGNYGYVGGVNCGITVSTSTITCGTVGWSGWAVSAAIAPDGTFLSGTPQGDDNYLAGSVAADGQVTLTAWRKKECYSVPSGRFCDGKATDTSGSAKAYQMCRTKDLVFQSGGWASGYFTECSKCRPEDDCTRYPAK